MGSSMEGGNALDLNPNGKLPEEDSFVDDNGRRPKKNYSNANKLINGGLYPSARIEIMLSK
jgi:hypothetical protein